MSLPFTAASTSATTSTTAEARAAFAHRAPLAPGDRVWVVAPSGRTDDAGFDHAQQVLTQWGLDVRMAPHIRDAHPRAGYLAGADDDRRADLVDAWCDPETAAVICLRGGYGAMRLLDGIDWDVMREHAFRPDGRPKLLTGSSDVTALHRAWEHHLGVPTLHCPMVGNAVFRTSAVIPDDVRSWLFEPWAGRTVTRPGAHTLVPGAVTGLTTGGNLSLLAGSLGAPENPAPADAGSAGAGSAYPGESPRIALLEDVDEDLYRLDGFLLQLQRAGWLDALGALVGGSWQDCARKEPGKQEAEPLDAIDALLREAAGHLGIPVVSELGFGHDPDALTVPLGVLAHLEAPEAGTPVLTILDPKEVA